MSIEAVKWAMDDAPMLKTERGRPDTTARGVLQALAEFAKKDGTDARPSIDRLEYRTGYDRRTIQRALRRLEAAELIVPYGQVHGCTRYRLAMELVRPASDWDEIEIRAAASKAGDAERQRRSRAKRVTHADDVTVTHSDDVTTEQMSRTQSTDVTHSDDMTRPDVTHSASRRHALSAALTTKEPPLTNEPPVNPTGPPHLQPAPAVAAEPPPPTPIAFARAAIQASKQNATHRTA